MKLFSTAAVALATLTTIATSTPVVLTVRCAGIDFSSLSMEEATFAGFLIGEAHGVVHTNDGSSVTSLSYHGALESSSNSLSMEDDPQQRLGKWGKKKHKRAGKFSGIWTCADAVCPDPDDKADLQAWENEFVAQVLMSPTEHEVFEDIKNCKITMDVADSGVVSQPNIDIGVRCDKKFSKAFEELTLADGTW